MKIFLKKLKSKVGESLVESLAAILIFTMASIVMYTMVTTAGDINKKVKDMDAKNQKDLIAVEKGLAANKIGSGDIVFTIGGQKKSIDVDVYGGTSNDLYAYYVHTEG